MGVDDDVVRAQPHGVPPKGFGGGEGRSMHGRVMSRLHDAVSADATPSECVVSLGDTVQEKVLCDGRRHRSGLGEARQHDEACLAWGCC